jgi:hypothetical protein
MRPFYLRRADIPELKPLTPAERTEVWAASAWAIFRDPLTYLVILVCGLCFSLAWFGGRSLADGYPGLILGVILGNSVASMLFWYYSAERLRPHLAENVEKRKLGK